MALSQKHVDSLLKYGRVVGGTWKKREYMSTENCREGINEIYYWIFVLELQRTKRYGSISYRDFSLTYSGDHQKLIFLRRVNC